MKKQFNEYLKEINSLTEHCVIEGKYTEGNLSGIVSVVSVEFVLSVKKDLFCDNTVLNPSHIFEMINDELFMKYFGKEPTYNNTHTAFWAYISKNIKYSH
jgi:hypothetical protein